MQFQADVLGGPLCVSKMEEASGAGAAYMAGISVGVYDLSTLFDREQTVFEPQMSAEQRAALLEGWMPVSYTHLDVYKRQIFTWRKRGTKWYQHKVID